MRRARAGCAAAAIVICMTVSSAEAHRPPPGYALEQRATVAGHVVEVMVVPKEPRAGEKAEVILNVREEDTGLPYQGYVTFRVTSPGGEAGPPAIPMEFGPGQFESVHVFRGPGVHQLFVAFDAQGSEHRVGPTSVTVRPPNRAAGGVALALACVTAVTYAAAFRHSRRRAAPGAPDG
jgi:hypothetical protein